MIFPVIFTFNIPPQGGEKGTIFKTLPILFIELPGSILISLCFFALFVFAALTSSIALVEVIVANLMELYQLTRPRAVIYTCIAVFLIVIPSALAGSNTLFSLWPKIFGKTFFLNLRHTRLGLDASGRWISPRNLFGMDS